MRLGELTKIVATIGPASLKNRVLESFVRSGVDVMRLNTSHGTLVEHKNVIAHIRKVAKRVGREVAIILDLPGPKLRLGELPQPMFLTRSHSVSLIYGEKTKNLPKSANLKVPAILAKVFKKGSVIAIDDGKILLRVTATAPDYAQAVVLAGGELTSHKGISVLGQELPLSSLTPEDKKALVLAPLVDFVAVSFIKNAKDVTAVKKLLGGRAGRTRLIAKIETSSALANLDAIIAAVDGVMVARGDLALSIDPAQLGIAQKEIVLKARAAGKPVIVATQMLDSMTLRPLPTRAEILDVTNAVIDHVDAVMLSSESAAGQYPRQAVKMMAHISRLVEKSAFNDLPLEADQSYAAKHLFSHLLFDFIKRHHVKIIVNEEADRELMVLIARHRLEANQIVPTSDKTLARQLNLVWGVIPVLAGKLQPKSGYLKKYLRKGQHYLVVGWHKKGKDKIGYVKIERMN